MTRRKEDMSKVGIADELIESVAEAGAILRGERPPARRHLVPLDADFRAIRHATGLSQAAFAARFGLGLAALRDWEQGRRRPDPAARTLLKVIAHAPEAVTGALEHNNKSSTVGATP